MTNNNIIHPIIIRKSILFLIGELFLCEFFFLGVYIVFELSTLFINNANTSTLSLLQADWIGILILSGLTMIQMLCVTIIVLQWVNNSYEIRNEDIIHRQGLFRTQENTYAFQNFTAAEVSQSIFGKIFNYGSIKIYNPAIQHQLIMKDITSPLKYSKTITENLAKDSAMVIAQKPTQFRR